ncbi:unnamed protein product [Ambrosiozyma monospora]|uniref:Unnamed protein product n=1 Tax=Ambrosiozyma monospora TaxID=43982 RepID=A0A9W6Z6I7_AMBMO|nr:unnamed protein product [Ambrosiozyma monospora]
MFQSPLQPQSPSSQFFSTPQQNTIGSFSASPSPSTYLSPYSHSSYANSPYANSPYAHSPYAQNIHDSLHGSTLSLPIATSHQDLSGSHNHHNNRSNLPHEKSSGLFSGYNTPSTPSSASLDSLSSVDDDDFGRFDVTPRIQLDDSEDEDQEQEEHVLDTSALLSELMAPRPQPMGSGGDNHSINTIKTLPAKLGDYLPPSIKDLKAGKMPEYKPCVNPVEPGESPKLPLPPRFNGSRSNSLCGSCLSDPDATPTESTFSRFRGGPGNTLTDSSATIHSVPSFHGSFHSSHHAYSSLINSSSSNTIRSGSSASGGSFKRSGSSSGVVIRSESLRSRISTRIHEVSGSRPLEIISVDAKLSVTPENDKELPLSQSNKQQQQQQDQQYPSALLLKQFSQPYDEPFTPLDQQQFPLIPKKKSPFHQQSQQQSQEEVGELLQRFSSVSVSAPHPLPSLPSNNGDDSADSSFNGSEDLSLREKDDTISPIERIEQSTNEHEEQQSAQIQRKTLSLRKSNASLLTMATTASSNISSLRHSNGANSLFTFNNTVAGLRDSACSMASDQTTVTQLSTTTTNESVMFSGSTKTNSVCSSSINPTPSLLKSSFGSTASNSSSNGMGTPALLKSSLGSLSSTSTGRSIGTFILETMVGLVVD